MINFDNFKKVSIETAKNVKDFTVKRSKQAKTKVIDKTTELKLKNKISEYNHEVDKIYKRIGKRYYDLYRNNNDEDFNNDCADITIYKEKIDELSEQLNKLNS